MCYGRQVLSLLEVKLDDLNLLMQLIHFGILILFSQLDDICKSLRAALGVQIDLGPSTDDSEV